MFEYDDIFQYLLIIACLDFVKIFILYNNIYIYTIVVIKAAVVQYVHCI